jgi:hypothetical protein
MGVGVLEVSLYGVRRRPAATASNRDPLPPLSLSYVLITPTVTAMYLPGFLCSQTDPNKWCRSLVQGAAFNKEKYTYGYICILYGNI